MAQQVARVENGIVVERGEIPNDITIGEAFHPSLDFRLCAGEVEPGWIDGSGTLMPAPPPAPLTPEELVALKVELRAEIDRQAEAERLKYITPGTGQAMTYARKLEEARAADSEVDPDPADYPLLAASVGIDGADIAGVADLVLAMDAQWTMIGAAIEAVRLGTKKAVSDAVDQAAAQAAFEAVEWPAPA